MNFGYRCGRTDRLSRIDESIRDPRIDGNLLLLLVHFVYLFFSGRRQHDSHNITTI